MSYASLIDAAQLVIDETNARIANDLDKLGLKAEPVEIEQYALAEDFVRIAAQKMMPIAARKAYADAGMPTVTCNLVRQRYLEYEARDVFIDEVEFDATPALVSIFAGLEDYLTETAGQPLPKDDVELDGVICGFMDDLFHEAVDMGLVDDWPDAFECEFVSGYSEWRAFMSEKLDRPLS